jgi:hypothetical protein
VGKPLSIDTGTTRSDLSKTLLSVFSSTLFTFMFLLLPSNIINSFRWDFNSVKLWLVLKVHLQL